MSSKSNVFSQGSGGSVYEFEVQTAFFLSFLIGCPIPGLPGSRIKGFRQQSGSLGYATDDLLLECTSNTTDKRVLIQIKHNLLISERSETFKEVVAAAWSDFTNPALFNQETDKIYIIKSALTISEKNHLKQLFNWANSKATANDFINEVNRIKDKKNYLDLFKTIINSISPLATDEEVFKFLKRFDVLEYDFGNVTSIAKTNFLSLIDLTKTTDNLSSTNIWDSIFTFISDSDPKGGYFTNVNIPATFSAYFNKSAFNKVQKQLQKLSAQNFEILDFIENSIGNITLNREKVITAAIEKLNRNRFLLLTGDPGVGKSAIAKALFNQIKADDSGYILLFKADQLNENNLRDLFLPWGITQSLSEIFSYFPLFTENYIYIDAVEKLLEGEGAGFKQLLKAIKDLPRIKLVISCRKTSLNLIELKYFHSEAHEIIDIPVLDNPELEYLAGHLPVLKKIVLNKRLLSLVKIPKYLDYAFRAASATNEDYSTINEVDFINKLWSIIIENRFNEYNNGFPARRSKLFINVAIERAKSMQPFIKPHTDDLTTLEKLEKDNVLVQSTKSGYYAPAHDVLEDWGLIRFVDENFTGLSTSEDFFSDLGTEPAMRRAYRLWVQSALKERDESKIKFFTNNLKSTTLDSFWKDESLIAVLNSEYCDTFLRKNLSILKENDWKLFFQVVHVMRMACKESDPSAKGLFIPIGYGWSSVIKILHESLNHIAEKYYPLVFNTISDWQYILFQLNEVPNATRPAGLIALHLLNNYYLKRATYYDENKSVENSLKLVFNLCGGIKEEVTSLLSEALKGSERDENVSNWQKVRYYEKVISLALSGLSSTQLSKHLPDELIKIAKNKWYRKPPKPPKGPDDIAGFLGNQPSWDDTEYYFGLQKDEYTHYFPASAYQTPVLWLLRNHPLKSIEFIIELLNHATKKYINSEFSEDDGCTDIELKLPDGRKITQHGSIVLWLIYRGTGKVTPNLLQSVLMALELFLFEVAKWGEDYKTFLQKLLNIMYSKSETVATTSVIASVCMESPLLVGNLLLPLFSNRKLISWDVTRYTNDISPFHFMMWNQPYDNERMASDKLPHRTKYQPGLKGFIISYCFEIGLYNKELFEILDEHRKNAKPNDIEWKKILDDMDVRKWKPTKEYKEGDKVGFLIEPSYEGEVKNQVDEWNKLKEIQNKNAGYKITIRQVQKNERKINVEEWREICQYYQALESIDFLEHAPGALAAIGIRDLWPELNQDEKEWSVGLILDLVNKSIAKQYKPYETSFEYSIYDMDGTMTVFPRFITLPELQSDRKYIQKMFIQLLITHYQLRDPNYVLFLKAFDEYLWENAPGEALKFFKGLIAFAKFTKKNPFYANHRNTEDEVKKFNRKYNSFIQKIYLDKFTDVISEFNYTKYSKWVLHKAIQVIPKQNPPEECIEFLKKLFEFWLADEPQGHIQRKYDEMDHNIQMALRDKMQAIIFWNAQTTGGNLLEFLLNRFNDQDVIIKAFDKNEIWNFYRGVLEGLIMMTDTNSLDKDPVQATIAINNFQSLWHRFDAALSAMSVPIFQDLLLLNIEWKEESSKWKPIEGMTDFFEKAISKYGASSIQAVINLLSHVGDTTMLPQGINWLVTITQIANDPKPLIQYKYADLLIHRVYNNHLSELMADKKLFENYLWMLNDMISFGSSDAYWIREFLISFRHN